MLGGGGERESREGARTYISDLSHVTCQSRIQRMMGCKEERKCHMSDTTL